MYKKLLFKEIKDWTKLDKSDPFWTDVALSSNEINFGLHKYKGDLYTSGYIGIGRLTGSNGNILTVNGQEKVVIIKPSYSVDPWKMLEKVMTDYDEYNLYIDELKQKDKLLYKVFYDQPSIKVIEDNENGSELLTALSFINTCYTICRRKMKTSMSYEEENLTAKIKGKVVASKNLRMNTMKGHIEKFYCKYAVFSLDNVENRILKSGLNKAEKILRSKYSMHSDVGGKIHFCKVALKTVKNVPVTKKHFNMAKATGLYSFYKPAFQQAKYLIFKKHYSYGETTDGNKKYMHVTPYMINMETLFEFYVRIIFKEYFKSESKYEVERYSKQLFIKKNVSNKDDVAKGVHIIQYCIPDILIKEKASGKYIAVFDVKYKDSFRSSREDSYQLLSYALLTGAVKCGFVFPSKDGETSKLKKIDGKDYITVETPVRNDLKYYEILLNETVNSTLINTIFA